MSKVVIFGGSGFVGQALRRQLDISYVAPTTQEIDLIKPDAPFAISEMVNDGDTVVMLSVLTQEKGDIQDTTLRNVMMARNLLAGLKDRKLAHFVYVSSDSVYGKAWENIDQNTPVCPDTLYGYMHAMREQYFREYFPGLTILRPCAIYGIGDTHNSYGVNRFIRDAKAKGIITLFGEGEEYRSNIHVDDVAAIIVKAVKEKISGTFNAVSGKSWRFSEIAEFIKNNIDTIITHNPRTVPITHRHFNNSSLCENFFIPRSADVGIKEML